MSDIFRASMLVMAKQTKNLENSVYGHKKAN